MGNWYKHIIIWSIFILYEISFVTLLGVHANVIDYALHYAINIALFYVNVAGFQYIFASRFNKPISIALFISLELVVYLLFEYGVFILLTHLFHLGNKRIDFFSRIELFKSVYRGIYFIGFSIGYWFALSVTRQKKIILELENSALRDKMQSADLENKLVLAKNAYLQSQLNPHFLFNTLNFIYNSVRKVSAQGASAILLLSDMMRYSLSDAGVDGKVSLDDETAHIKNFIALNQVRFDKTLNVIFNLKGAFENEKIIPLVLISFIENIYKHGDLTDETFPTLIDISCHNRILKMNCVNKKNRSFNNNGWGIGVANAKARLDTYYTDKYKLEIIEDDYRYEVLLAIQL